MRIYCSEKLQKELRIYAAEPVPGGDSEYSWHADLIEVGGRQAVLLVHDASLFPVLWVRPDLEFGVVAEQRFREMIFQSLREQGIRPEVLNQYFISGGMTVMLPEISSGEVFLRAAAARIRDNDELIAVDHPVQYAMSREIGRWETFRRGQLIVPIHEIKDMLSRLRERDEEGNLMPMYDQTMFQLFLSRNIDGQESSFRMLIPSFCTFLDLYVCIEAMFIRKGFSRFLPHYFYSKKQGGERVRLSEYTLTLREAFSFGPLYFFQYVGESHEYVIALERVMPHADWNYPQLVQAFAPGSLEQLSVMEAINRDLRLAFS